MEGIFGIEPKHSESKSDALPLCYIPIVWRKMWDSNPRNLAVRLLSKELRSTTLAIFLCLASHQGVEP